jgi:hypothetical protein
MSINGWDLCMKPKQCVMLLFPVFVACTLSPLEPSMNFRRVVAGFGPFPDRNVQVVRDASTWNVLLQRMQFEGSPSSVEFSSEMVIVVSPGERSPCYGVNVDRIERKGQQLTVTAIEQKPAASCVCVQMAVSPFEALAIRKGDFSIDMAWTDRIRPCRPGTLTLLE